MNSQNGHILKYGDILRPNERAWVYVVSCDRFHKVGITQNLEQRMRSMTLNNPMDLKVEMYRGVPYRHVRFVEMTVHQALAPWHHRGEWFTAPLATIKAELKAAISLAGKRERKFVQAHKAVLAPFHTS